MHLMGADDNGPRGSRAGVFAGSAADTEIRLDDWHGEAIAPWDHLNSSGRAMFGAGSAGGMFLMDDTEVLIELGNTELDPFFFGEGNRLEGGSWADLQTAITFVGAGTGVEVHVGLEEAGETVVQKSGLQDTGGALGEAEAASGAAVVKALGGAGSGRGKRREGGGVAFGRLAPALSAALSGTAPLPAPLLGENGEGGGEHGRGGGEKGAAGTEAGLDPLLRLRRSF